MRNFAQSSNNILNFVRSEISEAFSIWHRFRILFERLLDAVNNFKLKKKVCICFLNEIDKSDIPVHTLAVPTGIQCRCGVGGTLTIVHVGTETCSTQRRGRLTAVASVGILKFLKSLGWKLLFLQVLFLSKNYIRPFTLRRGGWSNKCTQNLIDRLIFAVSMFCCVVSLAFHTIKEDFNKFLKMV